MRIYTDAFKVIKAIKGAKKDPLVGLIWIYVKRQMTLKGHSFILSLKNLMVLHMY